jgi:hypothetical protein
LLCLSASLSIALLPSSVTSLVTVSAARGHDLYHGEEALNGRIRGHDDVLPPDTVRCVNCHEAKINARLPGKPAPLIDSALLLEMRHRRGGPPSRYDQAAFCRLLRTGSDPAYILIAREMPAYDLEDAQCASLWTFLLGKETASEDSGEHP